MLPTAMVNPSSPLVPDVVMVCTKQTVERDISEPLKISAVGRILANGR